MGLLLVAVQSNASEQGFSEHGFSEQGFSEQVCGELAGSRRPEEA